MAQIKKFCNGIVASVVLLGKKHQLLEINDDGVIAIPEGIKPGAFCLVLHAEEKTRVVFAQKNIGQENGGYGLQFPEGVVEHQVFSPPIQVARAGENVWTLWHQKQTNRMDCWLLETDGRLELFQVGVITHDDGQTFRLIGEARWQGRIFKSSVGFVALPRDQKFGPLLWNKGESRADIRQSAEFQQLLASANLAYRNCVAEELYPPLGPIPDGNYARVDWYIPFAGQKGQGIAKDKNGRSYTIHGQDLAVTPNSDGVKRLWHNDLISHIMIHKGWGTKPGPPKLLGIKKVHETAYAPATP